MSKNIGEKKAGKQSIAGLTADIHGVTRRYVNMIISGKRSNEAILGTYKQLEAGQQKLIEQLKKEISKASSPSGDSF